MAKNDGSKFICKLCNEEFVMKYFFMNHSEEFHRRTKIPKELIFDKLKPIEDHHMECLECSKTFSSKETARSHYKKLHLNKRFNCTVCRKDFPAENCMKKHMKFAHMLPRMVKNGENEKYEWKIVKLNEDGRINCLDCCKTFFSMTTAKENHKNVHMTKETFKCEVCLKHFRYKSNVKIHYMKMHMVKKDGSKFHCKLCNEGFTTKYFLMNHLRDLHNRTKIPKEIIYEKLKPIEDGRMECLGCNKIFSSKKSARSHFLKWHMAKKDDSKFHCKLCNEEFTIKYCLVKHFQDLHGRTKIPKAIICEN